MPQCPWNKPRPRRLVFARVARLAWLGLAASIALGLGPLPAIAQERLLKLAAPVSDQTPWAEALKRYKAAVQARSAGRISVQLFLGGQLGGEAEVIERCRRGQLQAVAGSAVAMAAQVPEVAVLQLPYLFKNSAELLARLRGDMAAPLSDALAAAGLTLGFWLDGGDRHLANRVRPIHSPADLRGLRIRSEALPTSANLWRALGAVPQGLAPSEVAAALQAGRLDGLAQSLPYLVAARWLPALPHLTLTGHAQPPALVVYHQGWYQALPADLRAIVDQEGLAAERFAHQQLQEGTPTLIAVAQAAGVQVIALTASERAAFEKAALALRAPFRKKAPKSAQRLLDLIEEAQKRTL